MNKEHVFPPEMMYEREKHLLIALLDCAGVCYDINFTQNKILGNPIQIVDGVEYPILEQIGMEPGCKFTDIVDYWAARMPSNETAAFISFSDIERIKSRYEAGEKILRHKFWTYDVLGNSMLAEQKTVLYKDITCGDLLGITYVSNASEIESVKKKEHELNEQYREAAHRAYVLQKASVNVPGGYHRCSPKEGYPFLFMSHSFEELVGYTREQIEKELDNKFINLVIPEDYPKFDDFEHQLKNKGVADIAYRIRRRDGSIRWVQDSTLLVDWEGEPCLQCTIADITDFVSEQEAFAKQRADFEELAANIPCGYHRCTTDGGFRLEFVSDSFLETVGYTKEELLGKPFFDLVAPEDQARFMQHEPELATTGKIELVYRIVRKDGTRRWIKDSTMRIVYNGHDSYQCILADITDFVNQQEEMMRRNLELMHKETLMEIIESNMPGGYHRCAKADGWPFLYFGESFEKITGWSREEIERDFGNLFINMVLEEDIPLCAGIIEETEINGYSNAIYRIKKKGGGYIWLSDSTMSVNLGEDSIYHGVIADVTPQIEALEKAKREAEESNLAKSTFLFNTSHDIRTPLNAIQGFANIIKQNTENHELVRKNTDKILQSSKTLMSLLNDVLDLSRIERGKDYIDEQPIDISETAEKLYELFNSDMIDAGLDYRMENSINNKNVLGDELKITRIAMNLLSNAKKFTPRGGSVAFGITETSCNGETADYTITVRDTGIGMSREFQNRAFEQFERERSSTESGISGSGLGLAIIKRLSTLLGGSYSIKSEVGKGSEISVTLPLKLSHNSSGNDTENLKGLSFDGLCALIVEDNEFNREIARYVFETIGFTVDDAENGVICLDKLNSGSKYDFILMDIQMPIMDGYTAAKEIRRHTNPEIAKIPIIAMTANAFDEDRQHSHDAGMNGHIAKPLDAVEIIKELKRVLAI